MAMANVGTMQLNGVAELKKLLAEYPAKVVAQASKVGMKKAAQLLAADIAAAAPTRSGKLRRAIVIKRVRGKDKFSPRYKVGLGKIRGDTFDETKSQIRFYYKTLELKSKRGAALNPFFMTAWNASKGKTAQLIIDETKKAIYDEAAKIHRKSLGLKKKRGKK